MPNGREAAIESYVPGRVRIRIPREQRDGYISERMQTNFREVKGVRNVFVNHGTGSVLVEYDPGVLNLDRLKKESGLDEILADINKAAEVVDVVENWPSSKSFTAENIIRNFKQFDQSVSRITRGVVDMRTVVPLLLLGMSLGRYVLSEKRTPTPWHSLLWYGYSMFMHWNNPNRGGPSLR